MRAGINLIFVGAALGLAAGGRPAKAQEALPAILADVTVTARQRPETIQEIPLAVRAISAEQVRELRPVQLSDISGAAPNFSIERAGGLDTVIIRGAGGGGRNIGFGPRTAVYLDGVYIAQTSALNRSLIDAERVEVLRGPQGALFGRNTVSGAVDIVSRAPGEAFGGEARAWVGSRRSLGAFAAVDLPLDPNRAWLRVSALRDSRGGYTRNAYDGSRDLGSYRVMLRLQPDTRLKIDLAADYALDLSLRDGFEAVSNSFGGGTIDPYAPAPFVIAENTPRVRRNAQYGISLNAAYALPGGASLTWISAYRAARAHRRSDNDYSPLDLLATDYRDRFGQASQEIRLASGDDRRLRYVIGAFYLHEANSSDRVAAFGPDTTLAGLPVAPGAVVTARGRIGSASAAAFANLDYRLTRRWSLSAGVRLNRERRRLLFDLDGGQSGALRIGTLSGFRDHAGERRATPSVSLAYAPDRRLNLYGRYAEGFKSGGWNVDFLNTAQVTWPAGSGATPFAFGPETVRSYELGVKAQFWGGKARIDATAFRMSFRDYQVNKLIAFPGGQSVIQLTNASSATTSGLELTAELRPTPFVAFTLDAATLDAHFGHFPGGGAAGGDASNNRLPYAPRFSARLGLLLTAPVDPRRGRLTLFVSGKHRSFVYTGQENLASDSLPGSEVIDARLAWRAPGGAFELAAWSRNLADASYLSNSVRDFLGTRTVTHGDPRSFGVELSGRF